MIKVIILCLIFSNSSQADVSHQSSPLQDRLEKDQLVRTKEYVVIVEKIPYYKVEYEGQYHYFRVLQRKDDVPKYLCERPEDWSSEELVEASIKISKRTRLFFQGLKEKCTTRDREYLARGQSKRHWIDVDPIVGIHISDGKGDVIKNKKIGIPLKALQSVQSISPHLMMMGEF